MQNEPCNFSLHHLCDVLLRCRRRRRFLRFGELGPGHAEGVCLLRHDVDLSLDHAARLAGVEQQMQIASTFFVRMGASGYNPLSRRGRAILRSMEQSGSEVGLHYEGAASGEEPRDAWRRFLREKAALEDVVGHGVGVAAHMSKRLPAFNAEAVRSSGVLYDVCWPERFGGLSFVSDSNRRWRGGCMCRSLSSRAGLHLLLHPVWWMAELREREVAAIIRKLQDGD